MPLPPTLLQLGLIVGIAIGSTAMAWAAQEHHHDSHATTELTLNNGEPWPTDAPLRQGMEAIHREMAGALPRIHANGLAGEEYAALANRIDGHIAFMVKNCKLSPEVDAQAHLVLEQIIEGAHAMAGKTGQVNGAVMIVQALDRYARHFDHPGWQPLNH